MKVIHQSCEWVQSPPVDTLQLIEKIGRVCYKSEDRITTDSAKKFVAGIMARGHESVIEHVSASVRFITDRGVTHEMVRHRLASYSQESTRYCNYGKAGELVFIEPVFWINPNDSSPKDHTLREVWASWYHSMAHAEREYLRLLQLGASPQEARTVLPNSLKTEIVMTANLREWRHFFKLRCPKTAHPQMRDLACKALTMFFRDVPVVFNDLADNFFRD